MNCVTPDLIGMLIYSLVEKITVLIRNISCQGQSFMMLNCPNYSTESTNFCKHKIQTLPIFPQLKQSLRAVLFDIVHALFKFIQVIYVELLLGFNTFKAQVV